MRDILAFLLVLLAASAWAQQPSPRGTPAGLIAGTITSTAGGPLEGAAVVLMHARLDDPSHNEEPKTIFAGPGGRYRFDELEPGIYFLLASHPGYVVAVSGSEGLPEGKGKAILLAPNEQQELNFSLKPLASISGSVLDRDGNGLEGFTVTAERSTYFRGVRTTVTKADAVSDDRGAYIMEDLAPGRYYIRARRPQQDYGQISTLRAIKPGERDLRLDNTFYPGAAEASGAAVITMEAGRTVDGIDIRMLEREFFSVSGKVVGPDPDMAGSHVLTSPAERSGAAGASGPIQEDGSFVLTGVPAGPAHVVYWHQSDFADGSRTWGSTSIDVREPLENVIVDIRVQDISGSMRVEGERELDELAAAALKRASIRLRSVDGSDNRSNRPGAAGSFTLSDIPRGRYIVDVDNLYGGPYLKELRLAGQSILDSVVDFTGGFPDGAMEVVVSTDGGVLNGSLRTKGGEAPQFATITLVPASRKFGHSRLYPTGDADPGGAYEVTGITPGRYEVFAWERIEETAHWNEDFMRPFLTRGKVVEIEEGKTEYLDLDIITAQEMEEALMRAGLL